MPNGDEWVKAMTQRTGREVRRLRGDRSGQWLADRTAELGWPVARATISQIELGQRKALSVAEILVLAKALDTSPVTLVFPGPYDEPVEVVPGVEGIELWAAQWFSGLFSGLGPDDGPDQARAYKANTRALNDARAIAALSERRRRGDSNPLPDQ